jgi:uncharacterized membrane protein YkvA (DUF1232 family)
MHMMTTSGRRTVSVVWLLLVATLLPLGCKDKQDGPKGNGSGTQQPVIDPTNDRKIDTPANDLAPDDQALADQILAKGQSFAGKPDAEAHARAFAKAYRPLIDEIPSLHASLVASGNDSSKSLADRVVIHLYALYYPIKNDWIADDHAGGYGLLDDWIILKAVWVMLQPSLPRDEVERLNALEKMFASSMPFDAAFGVWNDWQSVPAYVALVGMIPPQGLQPVLDQLTGGATPPAWRAPAPPPPGSKSWAASDAGINSFHEGSSSMMLFPDGSSVVAVGGQISVYD